jgi:hypothetical protein
VLLIIGVVLGAVGPGFYYYFFVLVVFFVGAGVSGGLFLGFLAGAE